MPGLIIIRLIYQANLSTSGTFLISGVCNTEASFIKGHKTYIVSLARSFPRHVV